MAGPSETPLSHRGHFMLSEGEGKAQAHCPTSFHPCWLQAAGCGLCQPSFLHHVKHSREQLDRRKEDFGSWFQGSTRDCSVSWLWACGGQSIEAEEVVNSWPSHGIKEAEREDKGPGYDFAQAGAH